VSGFWSKADRELWKTAAAKRAAERHTHADVRPGKATNAKDTKRWCKGYVGREHKTDVKSAPDLKGWGDIFEDYQILYCVKCGKELARYYPSRLWAMPKPAWAK
jgi:hypothetical protein